MSRLMQQRILLARIFVAIFEEADRLGWYLAGDFLRRCVDCPVGHPHSAHKESRALDVVLYHKATGAVCSDETVFAALHDVADGLGAAARIPGDSGHFSVADEGQVR